MRRFVHYRSGYKYISGSVAVRIERSPYILKQAFNVESYSLVYAPYKTVEPGSLSRYLQRI